MCKLNIQEKNDTPKRVSWERREFHPVFIPTLSSLLGLNGGTFTVYFAWLPQLHEYHFILLT